MMLAFWPDMRLTVVAGILVLTAGIASADWLIELNGGDRMTVDSYWEDGGRLHFTRDGGDVSVPRSRVRSIREVPSAGGVTSGRRPATAPVQPPTAHRAPSTEAQPSREELEAQRRRVDKHLLRVQRERFEAANRGDSAKDLKKIEREFRRTKVRSRDADRAIEALDGSKD
jgi:hypothetical protein